MKKTRHKYVIYSPTPIVYSDREVTEASRYSVVVLKEGLQINTILEDGTVTGLNYQPLTPLIMDSKLDDIKWLMGLGVHSYTPVTDYLYDYKNFKHMDVTRVHKGYINNLLTFAKLHVGKIVRVRLRGPQKGHMYVINPYPQ